MNDKWKKIIVVTAIVIITTNVISGIALIINDKRQQKILEQEALKQHETDMHFLGQLEERTKGFIN